MPSAMCFRSSLSSSLCSQQYAAQHFGYIAFTFATCCQLCVFVVAFPVVCSSNNVQQVVGHDTCQSILEIVQQRSINE